ncbi:hypothetical protein [Bradyrhizobium elkanii]|uniref:hypothetical protein n=1 Tax=Bradyrhizobium elkanii TaxID=29448 RepID=UPI0004B2B39B|nr:hypothetical protein [Bradyrhizobium elkanii]WLA79617.1 hypothetical protein QNJ99_30000 [Bradyrhizobium elkanii]
MHTKDLLADALLEIGLKAMSVRAREGYYHDFLSPLPQPEMQLVNDLAIIGTPQALALRERVKAGDFDASEEESEVWANSEEGQETFCKLSGGE